VNTKSASISRFSLQRACQLIELEEADAAYYRDEYLRLGQQHSADKRANDVRAWQCAHAVLTAALAEVSPPPDDSGDAQR